MKRLMILTTLAIVAAVSAGCFGARRMAFRGCNTCDPCGAPTAEILPGTTTFDGAILPPAATTLPALPGPANTGA